MSFRRSIKTYRKPASLLDISREQCSDHRRPDDSVRIVHDSAETGTGNIRIIRDVLEETHGNKRIFQTAISFPEAETDEGEEASEQSAEHMSRFPRIGRTSPVKTN